MGKTMQSYIFVFAVVLFLSFSASALSTSQDKITGYEGPTLTKYTGPTLTTAEPRPILTKYEPSDKLSTDPAKIIDKCTTISKSGSYALDGDITSEDSCLKIELAEGTKGGVNLDCRGNSIIYAVDSNGIGIEVLSDNVLIKNCVIYESSEESKYSHGVFISGSENVVFKDNEIIQNSGPSTALKLSNVMDSMILNNKILANANRVMATEDAALPPSIDSVGMQIESSSNNLIQGNTIEVRKRSAIVFYGGSSDNNMLKDNEITSKGNGLSVHAVATDLTAPSSETTNFLSGNAFKDIGGYDLYMDDGVNMNFVFDNQEIGRYKLSGEGISLSVKKEGIGEIRLLEKIKGEGEGFFITLRENFAEIDSVKNPALNVPAIIVFEGLPSFDNPVILRNGEECSSDFCGTPVFSGSSVKFKVEGWSNYQIGEEGVPPQDPTQGDTSRDRRSGGGGGSCVTQWTCTEWSACSVDGTQTRDCSYPASYCAPVAEKPVEIQTCTVENEPLEPTTEPSGIAGFASRITGAVIGPNGAPTPLGWIIFLVLIAAVYGVTVVARRRMGAEEAAAASTSKKASSKKAAAPKK